MSWHAFTHHTLKTLLRVVQVLVFVVVPGILIWLQTAGLPRAFYAPLVEAADREGLRLEFSRMRLSLLEGLVIDGVHLRAKHLPANNEVAVDRAAVSLDWSRLAEGRVELAALDLRGAQLFLPVETKEGITRTVRLTKARARLMLSDGVVSIPLARFNLQGIDIVATGRVALGAPQAAPGSAPAQTSPTLVPPEVGHALEILESLDFGSNPPLLEVEFSARSGDARDLELSRVSLSADRARYGEITLRDIRLEGSYSKQVVDVRMLEAKGEKGGRLAVAGRWNIATGEAHAEAQSSLDPVAWLKELKPEGPWDSLSFSSQPLVELNLEVDPKDAKRVRAVGSVETGPFSFKGLESGGISGGFSWRGGDLFADEVVLRLPTGDIRGALMIQPDEVRLRVDCKADPLPLAALLDDKAREGIRKMEVSFVDPPHIRIDAAGKKLDPAALHARGTLELGRTAIHGSPMDGATADVSFENLALTLSNIAARRPEGKASGAFTYDFAKNQVRLDNVRSTMTVTNVLQWADPNVAAEAKPYRFKSPPDVTVNGVIGLKDITATKLNAEFTAPGGLDYDLLERTLNFGAAKGTLKFAGRQIFVDVPSASLFGGKVKMDATINIGQPGAKQKMEVWLDKVNFETLTRLYFDYKDSQGAISGRYDFTFVGGQPKLMSGKGDLLVENGNVFAIPVLGPLSFLMDAVVQGAGYQTARRATCDFTVADGEIRTENLDILGQGFSMIGRGTLFYIEDRMDFTVRVNAQGLPGIVFYPVSKFFEYVSDGKMTEPVWRPRILPKGSQKPAPEPTPKPSGAEARNGRA